MRDRLEVLSQLGPNSLFRQQHEALTEATLVRKRTQAKQRSDASGQRPTSQPDVQRIMETVRKGSLMMPAKPENADPPLMPSMASMQQQQLPYQQPPYQQLTPRRPTPQPPQPQQQPRHKPQEQQSPVPTPQPVSQSPPKAHQDGCSSLVPVDTAMASISESGTLLVPLLSSCVEH